MTQYLDIQSRFLSWRRCTGERRKSCFILYGELWSGNQNAL